MICENCEQTFDELIEGMCKECDILRKKRKIFIDDWVNTINKNSLYEDYFYLNM